jgi:branched-chain amino acid transport system permease protein
VEYILHIAVLVTIYATLAMSLDLVVGHTGLLSIAHAAFYGIGAYTSALLSIHFQVPFPIALAGAMTAGILVSFAVSVPALRLRDEYFVIATFAFQVIIFSVFNNWIEVTRGPLGIPGIPPPTLFGWRLGTKPEMLVLGLTVLGITYLIVRRLSASGFGRVLRAIREDESFAQSLGKNTVRFKVIAFTISAALAALAGSLYAHYITYIDPTTFTVMESILIVSMVIIGGAGSHLGAIVGAVVLTVMPELLRFVGLPAPVAANVREIIYGALLVLMMLVRPQGLLGAYRLGR